MDTMKVLETLLTEYEDYLSNDSHLSMLYNLARHGKATHKEGLMLAAESGEALAESLVSALVPELGPGGVLTLDDAMAVIPKALRKNHEYVETYLEMVQQAVDEAAGLGLSPIKTDFDTEKAAGIAKAAANKDAETVASTLRRQVVDFSVREVDESIKANARARKNIGLETLIVRKYSERGLRADTRYAERCQWCLSRCGTWTDYDDAYNAGCFERHPGCMCIIDYKVGKTHTRTRGWEG